MKFRVRSCSFYSLLILFAVVSPLGAQAAPRVLVELGERAAEALARRGIGRTAKKIDPGALVRGGSTVRPPAPLSAGSSRTGAVTGLEAKLPGLGEAAARRFPDPRDLARLEALPADQARAVVVYAGRATDPKAASTLLRSVEESGGRILEKLTPGKIVAGGLSTSMVVAAAKLSDAAAESPEKLVETIGESLAPVSRGTAVGIGGGLLLLAASLALRWLPRRRRVGESGAA